ncbi:MAG: hypothetical protein IKA74_02950 [Clostridia bacterium]|nr:hypothetical protein [Clostridia bacterium]
MIENDTIKLLRECDAGIRMGIDSLIDMLEYARDERLRSTITDSIGEHERLESEVESLLHEYKDRGKPPSPMAVSMSHIKTKMKMMSKKKDGKVADLVTDGCNMGVKSLNRYLNQYEAASERTKDIAKKLISIEKSLADNVCSYL